MKPLAPDLGCPVWAVLPPLLVERIHRHHKLLYGEEFTASNALANFCSQFITDAGALASRSRRMRWNWLLARLSARNSLDEYLADLSEPRLALLEAQVVNFGTSLEEIFIEMLIESKSLAAHTVG